MITVKVDGNPLDPKQSVASLLSSVFREMGRTRKLSCTVRFDVSPAGSEGETVKFRMTLSGASRRKPPRMT